MKKYNLYYQESGVISRQGIFYMISTGLIFSIVGSIIYAMLTRYIPFAQLNIIFLFILGLGLGGSIGYASQKGKTRNVKITLFLAGLSSILTIYFIWVIWVYGELNYQLLLLSPVKMLAAIKAASEEGVWSIGNFNPKGITLQLIWVAEALLIIGLTLWGTFYTNKLRPFCEKCQSWTIDNGTSILSELPKNKNAKRELEAKNIDLILNLNQVDEEVLPHTEVNLLSCQKSCPEKSFFLSVSTKQKNINGDISTKDIVMNLYLSRDEFEKIKKKIS